MDPRAKSALLWGAVGTFVFLTLRGGYHLLFGSLPLGVVESVLVALAVGAVVAAVSYIVENRLTRKGRV